MATPVSLDSLQPSSAPVADAAPATQPAETDSYLDSLTKLPIVQALQQGSPAAAYVPPALFGSQEAFDAEIPKLEQALPKLGLAVLKAPKSGVLVVYNPNGVSTQDLAKADAAGTLGNLAMPITGQQDQSTAPQQAATTPQDISAGLTKPPGAPLPAGVQDATARARLTNVVAQPPVKDANPSLGIINGLQKRAI